MGLIMVGFFFEFVFHLFAKVVIHFEDVFSVESTYFVFLRS
jgi:hypothetical protein